MAVSPEIETEKPNTSLAAASEAVNFADSVRVPVQPPPGFTKIYAEPESSGTSLLEKAPTMAVSPEIETEEPNPSPRAASEAVSLACCVQTPAVLVNIYAEPELSAVSSSRKAPTMAVSPEIETEMPKLSPRAASEAVSF